MLVNFVIGGTQKGGTSALDAFFRQHPQICMPRTKKELHFFDQDENMIPRPNYKAYHANFDPQPQHRVMGEATPIYMYWNTAPARIWTYNPAMKWIIVLRNPVERAYSAWNMERQRGEDHLPFSEAVAQEAERCRAALPLQHRIFSYIDRGFYSAQLRQLFNIFGEQRCLVLLNEELRNQHQPTLRRAFEFLEIDSTFVPAEGAVFGHDYVEPMDEKMFAALKETFLFDIKQTERMLRRDLSAWYSP